jgi:hypothetical protein
MPRAKSFAGHGLVNMSRDEKERLALRVPCPICRATRGDKCHARGDGGAPRELAHRLRVVNAARADGVVPNAGERYGSQP